MSLSSSESSGTDSELDEEQLAFQNSLKKKTQATKNVETKETKKIVLQKSSKNDNISTEKKPSPKSIVQTKSKTVKSKNSSSSNVTTPRPTVHEEPKKKKDSFAKKTKPKKIKTSVSSPSSFIGLSSSDDDSDSDDEDFFSNVNSLLDSINLKKSRKKQLEEELKLAKEKEEMRRKEEEEKLIKQLEKKHTMSQKLLQEQIEKEKAEKELYKQKSNMQAQDHQQAQIELIERINKEVDVRLRSKENPSGIFGLFGTIFGLCSGSRDEDEDEEK
eukprot:g9010.t1